MLGVGALLLASMGVAFISRTAKTFQQYGPKYLTQRIGTSMYADGVEHSFRLPFATFEDRRSGEILQKLQRAKEDSQELIQNFIDIVFLSAIGILFVVIYAFTVHWLIGVVLLTIMPTLGIFTYIISRKIKEAQHAIVRESADLAGTTTETLRNVELVKSLG
jgi:ATP-binding cassette subfamily B protein